MLIFKTK